MIYMQYHVLLNTKYNNKFKGFVWILETSTLNNHPLIPGN